MKTTNLRIKGNTGEEIQLKGTENIFNKIIEENFSNLKKNIPMKVQEAYRTQNRLDPLQYIKTLSIWKKERILSVAKEKCQLAYKGRPIRITPYLSMKL